MRDIEQYKRDRHEIIHHPVKVTDEGIRLMTRIIDDMELLMRKFVRYELPDCMAREEMKVYLDGPRVPNAEVEKLEADLKRIQNILDKLSWKEIRHKSTNYDDHDLEMLNEGHKEDKLSRCEK